MEQGLRHVQANPSVMDEFVFQTSENHVNESTLKKDLWVAQLLEAWCREIPKVVNSTDHGLELDPCNHAPTMKAFLLFLSKVCNYSAGSIRDVIVPSLKRQFRSAHGRVLADDIQEVMKHTIMEIERTSSSEKGKAPALIHDVTRIVSKMPDSRDAKAAEASLFLFAVSLGARACTCEAVNHGDIQAVITDRNTGLTLVRILLRVTKGKTNWNHLVTLEGKAQEKSDTNVVYWLREHFHRKFGIDLLNRGEFTDEERKIPFWGWSKDVMRERFKKAAIKSGYPSLLFAFHSLRSGFICSALLKANAQEIHLRAAVLETTALVAGWVVGGRAQLRYVKAAAKGCIVASRLIAPSTEGLSNNPVEEMLTRPELFHGIEFGPCTWDQSDTYRNFNKRLRLDIAARAEGQLDDTKLPLFVEACVRHCYVNFVKKSRSLEQKAKLRYQHNGQQDTTIPAFNARRAVAKAHLERIMTEKNVEQQVQSLLNCIDAQFQTNKIAALIIEGPRPPRKPATPERPWLKGGQRKRIPWIEEEDSILTVEHDKGKSWAEISRLIPRRSNVDCKDRWRNIAKKKQRTE